ncbi:SchA/CurD [Micromonospora sagamiensis]|uniref:SchA/CurD like domain-containing protein n=2 Tax=Micromonospora sagamiensis TaxID=47875 RepID=A0A562WJW1_9ACTN|nr:SchA/CurD like domain-containing protein [Micromonospora sagamiensis]BCL16793.1 SchA/CurD [Micromonospora sagamiensis]
MPYAAIRYDVIPGHEDEIAEIFANFRRVSTPVLKNEQGEEVGQLLGSAVFISGEIVIRVIHYEGDFRAIGRHMGQQSGVHDLEGKLAKYLKTQRDTSTPEKFAEYFRNANMRCIAQLTKDNYPGPVPAGAQQG